MIDSLNENDLREAIELLYFSYREFTAGPDKILAKRGLGRVHHRILYFVGRNDGGSVSELLAILGVSKQALNAPLRQLVHMDLVSNNPSLEDRRTKALRLTTAGRRLEARLTGTQMDLLGKVFKASGAHAHHDWRSIMRDLAAV